MRLVCTVILLTLATAARADDAGAQFFESKIRPLLAEHCYSCHSYQAKKLKASLYLDSREAMLKGGESGPAIVPGSPEKSRLIDSVSYKNVDLQMPPKDKLGDQQIADLAAWVKMGAPWGAQAAPSSAGKLEEFNLAQRKAKHWAWQPVRPQAPPAVKDNAWPKGPIDHFILAKLEQADLRPAAPADRRTLIRRAHFAVTGLPPTPQEVEAFVADGSPNAFEAVVDRLLASPAFGERWARHWLDLVRYAETMGHEFDFSIPNAWRYRDYVIRALNADLPYDQFLVEQVAGDLLPSPRRGPDGTNESTLGTAVFFLGEDVQAPVDVRQHQADLFDNRIDVLGKSMLGLTVACARCHDHKFDAVSAADYYALYGYLKGARYAQATLNDRDLAGKVDELRRAKDALRRSVARHLLAQVDQLTAPAEVILTTFPARSGDFELEPDRWAVEGFAFPPCDAADFVVGDERRPVAALVGSAKAHSRLLSPRLEGAIRSPTVTIDRRYLHVRAAGANARVNVVIDNFNVIREPIYGGLKRAISAEKPAWITVDVGMWRNRQAYIEIIDNSVSDPGGPAAPANGWVAVERVLLSDQSTPPEAREDRRPIAEPANFLRTTLQSWAEGVLTGEPPSADTPIRAAVLAQVFGHPIAQSATDEISAGVREYRRVESTIPAPVYGLSAVSGTEDDEHLFIRGNPKNLGPKVPRRFLEALTPDSAVVAHGSASITDRLELARRIASASNPLTARVMVNRVWHHLFGRGLVASVDNFGALGDAPTHPELLDHLATRFVEDNWSIKRLIRSILLTQAWQQSTRAAEESAATIDPDNKLLHRQNVRRLEAEAIRDLVLTVSGRLDATMYGPGVPVHLTPFMDGRGKPASSGPVDGAGRRSVYLEVRRNFLPPMLLAFDTPTPFNTMGRRSFSNVPAQALILMNDPFVQQQATLWARRTLAEPRLTPGQRVARMYAAAMSRPPTADETRTLLAFLDEQGASVGIEDSQRPSNEQLWTDLAHALINTKELIFVN